MSFACVNVQMNGHWAAVAIIDHLRSGVEDAPRCLGALRESCEYPWNVSLHCSSLRRLDTQYPQRLGTSIHRLTVPRRGLRPPPTPCCHPLSEESDWLEL